MNPRSKALINFKKSESLLKKIVKMVEEGDYCIDIMQQNLAVVGMLKSAHQSLMEGHLNSCFKKAMQSASNKKQEKMIEEILRVSKIYNR